MLTEIIRGLLRRSLDKAGKNGTAGGEFRLGGYDDFDRPRGVSGWEDNRELVYLFYRDISI